jgi:hypothetical protein
VAKTLDDFKNDNEDREALQLFAEELFKVQGPSPMKKGNSTTPIFDFSNTVNDSLEINVIDFRHSVANTYKQEKILASDNTSDYLKTSASIESNHSDKSLKINRRTVSCLSSYFSKVFFFIFLKIE